MAFRPRYLLATLLVLTSGCGRVVIDDDHSSVDTSSATGGTTSGGGDVVAVGVGPSSTTGAGHGSGGAGAGVPGGGGDPGQGGSDPGEGGRDPGEGGAPPVESCAGLSWASPALEQGPWEDVTFGAVLLRPTSNGRAGVSWLKQETGMQQRLSNKLVGNAWNGELDWNTNAHGNFNRPLPMAVPGGVLLGSGPTGRVAYLVPTTDGGATIHEHIDDLAELPDTMGSFHAFTGVDGGFAVLHGAPGRLERSLVSVDGAITGEGVIACGDRPLAAGAVRSSDGGAILAQATAPGSCDAGPAGAPTQVRLDVVGNGGGGAVIDVGATVAEVHLAAAAEGGAFVAVRAEGAPTLRTFVVGADGGVSPVAEVPVATGRSVAIAARHRDLVVVDSGPASVDEPGLRVRILDPAGVTVATVGTPAAVEQDTFERALAVLVAPGAGSLLVASSTRDAMGRGRLFIARAECTAAR